LVKSIGGSEFLSYLWPCDGYHVFVGCLLHDNIYHVTANKDAKSANTSLVGMTLQQNIDVTISCGL
jgi:hypothetical protein